MRLLPPIGSTRLIADEDGDVVSTSEYDSFGVRVAHTGTADSRFGYSGNWTDPTTGLVYCGPGTTTRRPRNS